MMVSYQIRLRILIDIAHSDQLPLRPFAQKGTDVARVRAQAPRYIDEGRMS
jgi:hypothetical protein